MARQASGKTMLPRSFRIEQGIWDKARARAESEGVSVSAVIADLVEGYSRGVYDLPRTKITKQFPTTQ